MPTVWPQFYLCASPALHRTLQTRTAVFRQDRKSTQGRGTVKSYVALVMCQVLLMIYFVGSFSGVSASMQSRKRSKAGHNGPIKCGGCQ